MSPRAAVRLEQFGFADVYDYAAGKNDWTAAGLEREGKSAGLPTSGDLAHDVATCRLDDGIEDVRERADSGGDGTCVVTDGDGTVLGVVTAQESRSSGRSAGEVMRSGPVTIRGNETVSSLGAVAERMEQASVDSLLVTDPDGRLIGALERADAAKAAQILKQMRSEHSQ